MVGWCWLAGKDRDICCPEAADRPLSEAFARGKLVICGGGEARGGRGNPSESQFSIFPSTCQLKIDSIN